jgi:hypothetical protein
MMLTELATRDGRAGKWRAETHYDKDARAWHAIYHYSTKMLEYTVAVTTNETGRAVRYRWDGNLSRVRGRLGHGSKSDQQGMNRLFEEIGLPFYYIRKEGAEIQSTDPDTVVFPFVTWHESVA